ncbi:unnamed protein product [Prorocentrum cordatum]|uniref:Uncharacterized protein n=1 Tax=Prorocentrum cordatum TaxID=2364126 RepID=A0ABN9VC62_9DINO|nr:unnamed protein product [Polarella glacialis]
MARYRHLSYRGCAWTGKLFLPACRITDGEWLYASLRSSSTRKRAKVGPTSGSLVMASTAVSTSETSASPVKITTGAKLPSSMVEAPGRGRPLRKSVSAKIEILCWASMPVTLANEPATSRSSKRRYDRTLDSPYRFRVVTSLLGVRRSGLPPVRAGSCRSCRHCGRSTSLPARSATSATTALAVGRRPAPRP